MWNSQFCADHSGALINNTAYFIPIAESWLLAALNAPVGWWLAWRRAQHSKDEALRYFTTFVDSYPIPAQPECINVVKSSVDALGEIQEAASRSRGLLADWYRHSLGIDTIPTVLRDPFRLGADQFLYGKVGGDDMIARLDPQFKVAIGDRVRLNVNMRRIHLFDVNTERAIL